MHTSNRFAFFALALMSVAAGRPSAAELHCPRVQSETLATIDTGGDAYPTALVEMRIRPDGRPVILYTGGPSNAQSARVINCHDARCRSFDDTLLSSAFNYLDAVGLALSTDGRPLVLSSHVGRLTYFECANASCSLSRSVQIDPVFPGFLRTLLVRPDGRPQLVYAKGGNSDAPHDIVSYTCTDTRCDAGVAKTLVDVPPASSLTIGATPALDGEGRLVMSYLQNDGSFFDTDLQVLRCDDAACNTAQVRTVSSKPGYRNALFAWMHLLEDGRPLLMDDVSPDNTREPLLIECADGGCADKITTDLASNSERRLLGVAVRDTDRPLMGTLTPTSAGFYFCQDADCLGVEVVEAVADKPLLGAASLQMARKTRPLLAYFDQTGTKLKLLQCDTAVFANGFD